MSNGTSDPSQGSNRAVAENVQGQSQFYELLVKSNAEAEKQNELLKQRAFLLELSAKELKSETELQNSIATRLLQQVNEMEAANKKSAAAAEKRIKAEQDLLSLKKDIENLDDNSYFNQQLIEQQQIKIEQKEREILNLKSQEQEIQKDLFEFAKISTQEVNKYGNLLKIRVLDNVELSEVLQSQLYSEQQKRDALEEAKAINKDFLQLQTKTKSVTEKVAGNLGLAASFGDTNLGFAVDMHKRYLQMSDALGGKDAILGSMFKIAQQSFNFKNFFGSAVDFAKDAALQISNLSRDLAAATGYGDQFSDEIARMAQKGNMAGIGFKESADALKLLTTNLSSFNPKAERTNEYVGLTVARLGKLGVTSANAVKNVDLLQRSFGMTAEQAADTTAQIVRMGKSIGITGNEMLTNFDAMKTRIAAFGNTGMQVFKEMNALVKATGIALADLQSIASGLDTFDAAADSAGKLNAVLGTQLSTLELLEATDSERIMMIKQQVKMSVGNFENLDKYTKMYVAQAMGLKDVDKAQRLLNMSTAEYNKYTKGQQEQADIQAELAEATAELVPMMTQLKLIGVQVMMAFKPLITVFGALIKGISWILKPVGMFIQYLSTLVGDGGGGGMIEYMIGILGLAGIAWYAFGTAVMAGLGPIGWAAIALTALFGAFHLEGSPELWELPEHSAKGYENMANSMSVASEAALTTASSMEKVHNSMHKAGGKSFSIEAMAKLDTNKIADGLMKVKSAMMELSTLKIDGFLAMSTDGAKSSIVMGSQGVIKSLSEGRLSIDVNMPEISLPPINVIVQVNGQALEGVIDARVEKRAIQ